MLLVSANWANFIRYGLLAGAATLCLAQAPYPQTQYPAQQYPNQTQYPAPQQYPAGQYPPPSQQYPQYGQQQPPLQAPQQLDQLISRIALYPDGLLAQVLTASTYRDQIPDAATWAMGHQGMRGDQLAAAV